MIHDGCFEVSMPAESTQLSGAEAAAVMGFTKEVDAERCIGALKNLKLILTVMPSGLEGP